MTMETSLLNSILEDTLKKMDEDSREKFCGIFQQAIQEYACAIMAREKAKRTHRIEDDLKVIVIQSLAALGFLSAMNHVEWDKIGNPEDTKVSEK